MVETKVSELDNDENVKLTSDNNGLDTPHTYIMDTVNEEENDTNDASTDFLHPFRFDCLKVNVWNSNLIHRH
jgi:hypothetical protein